MDQVFGSVIAGLISGAIGAGAILWLRLARLEASQQEREEARKEWRGNVEKRLDAHAERLRAMADHETRLKNTEAEVATLRSRWHDLRDGTLKDAMKLFEEWRDEMVRKFQPRK